MQHDTMDPSSLLDLDRSPLVDAAVVLLLVALAALGTLLGVV